MSVPELEEVQAVLQTHLPHHVTVQVFGSRAGGTPKSWSDLDLALDGGVPLPLALMAALAEAFDASTLPWKVDLLDRAVASADFAEIIDQTAIPLHFRPD